MIIQANDTISRRFLRDSTKLWVHSVFSFSQSWFCIRLFRLNSTDKQQFPICTWYITKLLHKNINRNPYYYWTWFCGQIILHPYVEHVLAGNIMCVCVCFVHSRYSRSLWMQPATSMPEQTYFYLIFSSCLLLVLISIFMPCFVLFCQHCHWRSFEEYVFFFLMKTRCVY